ncbi:hypothetical protein PG993_012448 [Apiospora rasikravindrae]|uniref:Uncharacterized protein n=1 Tax=Apiospora rasikravindrae TaxID=990691 RepID=A0ABR1S3U0_9PEZI
MQRTNNGIMLLTSPRWRFALISSWLPLLPKGGLGRVPTGDAILDTTTPVWPEHLVVDTTANPTTHTSTATAATPTTLERMPTPSHSPESSASFPFSPTPNVSIQTTIYISPSPDAVNGASDDGNLRLGLGLGVGIGLPLMMLLGLGCFLLWRLLGKTCPIGLLRAAATADSWKQQRKHRDSDDDYAEAAYPKELESTETVTTAPPEILSTEVYEAGGASRQMRPVELGA